jgi:imidazolonepropionase-like amidohydrolase
MGLAAQVREQFVSAQEYLKKQERYRRALEVYREKLRKAAAATAAATAPLATAGSPAATAASKPPSTPASPLATASAEVGEEPEEPARDLRLEALGLALEKKLPVLVRAQREDDIRTALRLADEFKFRLVLRHGAEAWKVADLLAKRNIPVIVGPIGQQPSSFESPGARYDNAALLRKAGVTIAIQTAETHNVRNLPFAAGMAAAHGLTPEEALEAITAGAARVLGIAGRYGTLEKGKVANVAIFEGEPDGDPLQPRTKLRQLFIRGKQVPLKSRQTELFEKYR